MSISRGRTPYRSAWLSELLGTAALLFGALSVVRWLFADDSPLARSVSGLPLRLAIVGVGVGGLLALLIVSPLGRRSGGHLNPAVTVSFWLMGSLPVEDVAPYIAAQLIGSVSGSALARLIWGGRTFFDPSPPQSLIPPQAHPASGTFTYRRITAPERVDQP